MRVRGRRRLPVVAVLVGLFATGFAAGPTTAVPPQQGSSKADNSEWATAFVDFLTGEDDARQAEHDRALDNLIHNRSVKLYAADATKVDSKAKQENSNPEIAGHPPSNPEAQMTTRVAFPLASTLPGNLTCGEGTYGDGERYDELCPTGMASVPKTGNYLIVGLTLNAPINPSDGLFKQFGVAFGCPSGQGYQDTRLSGDYFNGACSFYYILEQTTGQWTFNNSGVDPSTGRLTPASTAAFAVTMATRPVVIFAIPESELSTSARMYRAEAYLDNGIHATAGSVFDVTVDPAVAKGFGPESTTGLKVTPTKVTLTH